MRISIFESDRQQMRVLYLFVIMCMLTLSSIPTVTSTFATTYRCEDSSGITILTDSPAQLDKCIVLFEDASVSSQATSSHMTSNSRQATSLQIQDDILEQLELEEENREYSFIDEQEENSLEEKSNMVTVPVTSYGGSLLVTVQLNHTREAQLILDTGATMTVLSHDVALDLGLIASTKAQLTTVNTAGGPIQVNVTKISSIQAGTALVNNVDVAIHDLPDGPTGIDGLLGMSFLNHFLVTLDTNQGQLHLKPRS